MKRAREQALREKRELKQAKKDARAAARVEGVDPFAISEQAETAISEQVETPETADTAEIAE